MVMAEITVSNSAPNVQNVSNCAPMRYRLKRKDIDPCRSHSPGHAYAFYRLTKF